MSYDTDVLEVETVKGGYDRIAGNYGRYHAWLNSFDKLEWKCFLPRSLSGLHLLDIGAGDGRTYGLFEGSGYGRYVACDVSEAMLQLHPGDDIETLVCHVEAGLPCENESFDLVLSFFVLEHIEDLNFLFEEVYRVLKSGGRYIVSYFPQRREFVHKATRLNAGRQTQMAFKIQSFRHRYEDIEKSAQRAFFDIAVRDIVDHGKVVGKAYGFVKK